MTIPWLMNCDHRPDGWCLECVQDLAVRNSKELAAVRVAASDTPRTQEAWAGESLEFGTVEHTRYCTSRDLERDLGLLRLKLIDAQLAAMKAQRGPEPWDWIPHMEGADRQAEINAHLRNLLDDIPMAKKP